MQNARTPSYIDFEAFDIPCGSGLDFIYFFPLCQTDVYRSFWYTTDDSYGTLYYYTYVLYGTLYIIHLHHVRVVVHRYDG